MGKNKRVKTKNRESMKKTAHKSLMKQLTNNKKIVESQSAERKTDDQTKPQMQEQKMLQ